MWILITVMFALCKLCSLLYDWGMEERENKPIQFNWYQKLPVRCIILSARYLPAKWCHTVATGSPYSCSASVICWEMFACHKAFLKNGCNIKRAVLVWVKQWEIQTDIPKLCSTILLFPPYFKKRLIWER